MTPEQEDRYLQLAADIAKATLKAGYSPSATQGLQYAVSQYNGPDEAFVHGLIGGALTLTAMIEAKSLVSRYGLAGLMEGIL